MYESVRDIFDWVRFGVVFCVVDKFLICRVDIVIDSFGEEVYSERFSN